MQRKLVAFYLFIFLYSTLIHSIETSLLHTIKLTITQTIESVFSKEPLSPGELQLLCNLFLCAKNYAQYDIKLNRITLKLTESILILKKVHNHCDNKNHFKKVIQLTKKLSNCQKKYTCALETWHSATSYLDQSEQQKAADFIRHITTQRFALLDTNLESNNKSFTSLVSNLHNALQQSATNINVYGNCFQALNDTALPLNQQAEHKNLEKLELANTLISDLEEELLSLIKSCKEFNDYYDSTLTISILIDTIYYQTLYEFMINNTYEENHRTVMFNSHGLIPENQRTEPLPHVVD